MRHFSLEQVECETLETKPEKGIRTSQSKSAWLSKIRNLGFVEKTHSGLQEPRETVGEVFPRGWRIGKDCRISRDAVRTLQSDIVVKSLLVCSMGDEV